MKIPWCLNIYLKGYFGYEETEGDSDLEFTLKVATERCSLDNFKAAVMARMEVKLQFRQQDSEYSKCKKQKLQFLNIGLRGRLATFNEMGKFIKNGFLILDGRFLIEERLLTKKKIS